MKAIFFDVDDTLYDQVDTFRRAYEEVFGDRFELDIKELFKARSRRSDEVFEDSQTGKITMEAMYIYRGQKAFEDLGFVITEEEALEFQAVYARNQANLTVPELTAQLLDELKAKGIQLGVITNGPSAHQWKKVTALNVIRWMPQKNLIVSGDIGIIKPNRGIFDIAKERAGVAEDEIWFVGDSYLNDIVGAKGAGWNALWINRWKKELAAGDVQPDVMVYDEAGMCERIREIVEA